MNRPKLSHAVLVALSLAVAAASSSDEARGAISRESYATAGKTAITIDGTASGIVSNVSGGTAVATVMHESNLGYAKKHIGSVVYDDLEFSVGPGSGEPMFAWLKATLANPASPTRKNGFVAFANGDYTVTDRLSFQNAMIDEVEFPLLDAASRDPTSIKVSLSVERTMRATTTGRMAASSTLKTLTASAFRIKLAGLDLSRVARIEPLFVRFKAITNVVGDTRDYAKSPGAVDVSNLELVIDASAAEPLYAWHQDFVIGGKNTDASEKTGSIEYLASDNTTVLYTLSLAGVGPVKVALEKQASPTAARRVRVEAYVESVSFAYTSPGT